MAKSKNALIKLSGTLYDATFVDSKAYGRHVRAPRGTYKNVKVNDTFSKNASQASVVNGTAKVIHDHIKSISGSFKQNGLWREFLKRMRKAPTKSLADLIASVKGLEINSQYALSRLITPQLYHTVSKQSLKINLTFLHHPIFDRKLSVDSYFYTLHLLYVNQRGEAVDTDGIETEWIQLTGAVPYFELSFQVPVKARYYVLILEVTAGLREVPLDVLPGKGIKVLEVGSINA